MDILTIIARILFSAIFIMSGFNHFAKFNNMVQYAQFKGAPAPKLLVPLSGLIILLGGLSFLFNFQIKVGAILLIVFLIPTTFIMHNFWKVEDPMMKSGEMAQFMKNLALIGAAFLIAF